MQKRRPEYEGKTAISVSMMSHLKLFTSVDGFT